MKDILTVYCQHGNERFGVLVAAELQKLSQEVLIGNPVAFILGKRYIDTDLNRSYNKSNIGNGIEVNRAKEVLKIANEYNVVLDLHTTKAKVGKVAILSDCSKEMLQHCAALGFRNVIIMPKHIVKYALVGNVRRGISLEFGSDVVIDENLALKISRKIYNINKNQNVNANLNIYYVREILNVKYRNSNLVNYKYSEEIGGYPLLVGETIYKTYAGFFADRTETVKIGSKDE